MPPTTELEIALTSLDARTFLVEMRATQPGNEADVRPPGAAPRVVLDFEALRGLAYDTEKYGQALGQAFFTAPVQSFFGQARSLAQSVNAPLRVRLLLDARLAELHRVRWELLRDPEDNSSLFTGENLLFSRYLSSLDWRPIPPRAKGQWHVLAAAANPSDLALNHLAPIDVVDELKRLRAALGPTPLTTVDHPTLDSLLTQLRAGCAVLYLICHGALIKDEPYLWLETAHGTTDRVKGVEFVTRLRELATPPLLVVLASCASATPGTGDALAALGPRLAEAGIPAVLAMQGSVSMDTITAFMPVFFRELARDGQIDRALAVARGTVRARPDHWMPVLFTRLKSGRLWYEPQMVAATTDDDQWGALLNFVQNGQCTPILGPGLFDAVLDPQREIATAWAAAYGYPLAPHARDDLPAVAQYLAVKRGAMFPLNELKAFLEKRLRARYGPTLGTALNGLPLPKLLTTIGEHLRATQPHDPHHVLAQLPCPVFVTANADLLLEDALRALGKTPRTQLAVWNDATKKLPAPTDDATYEPSAQSPLVFHLFGLYEQPRTLVLTEDDFLDYVINLHRLGGSSRNVGLQTSTSRSTSTLPLTVSARLTDTALLFVGFQPHQLSFRVLFRTILQTEGSNQLEDYTHVTAQMYPDETHAAEPEPARRYFEKYFQKVNAGIYWGSEGEFAKELEEKMRRQ